MSLKALLNELVNFILKKKYYKESKKKSKIILVVWIIF